MFPIDLKKSVLCVKRLIDANQQCGNSRSLRDYFLKLVKRQSKGKGKVFLLKLFLNLKIIPIVSYHIPSTNFLN